MTRLVYTAGTRFLIFFSGVGVAAIATLLTGLGNLVAYLSGVLAALFILYGLIMARNSENNKREEDREAIKDVIALIEQCVRVLDMVDLHGTHMTEGTSRALAHLATTTSLLLTRYRKYLHPAMAKKVRESEQMIVRVHVHGEANLPMFLESLRKRLSDMRTGVRDVDDPFLHMARRAI